MNDPKGTFRKYEDKKFKPETEQIIMAANAIIDEYEGKGYVLTLRQLYYQFVARGLIPNRQNEYNRLSRIISDGRLAGLISWTALEDRNRSLMGYTTFTNPSQAVAHVTRNYKIDMWQNQDWRPEVWVEKQAMESVVAEACNKLRVDFFATKGYNSQSEQWRAGRRFADYYGKGQRPIVFHLADHDPSGFDMTEDLRKRLATFCGTPVIVERLALNTNQVEQYTPPPNPAKQTDSRFEEYRRKFGDMSWEMDALQPDVIIKLISDAINKIRNPEAWEEMEDVETSDRMILEQVVQELGGS